MSLLLRSSASMIFPDFPPQIPCPLIMNMPPAGCFLPCMQARVSSLSMVFSPGDEPYILRLFLRLCSGPTYIYGYGGAFRKLDYSCLSLFPSTGRSVKQRSRRAEGIRFKLRFLPVPNHHGFHKSIIRNTVVQGRRCSG